MSGGAAKAAGVAAFFDADGTLFAKPSLERRFFQMLRRRKQIPLRNYLLWLGEAARLAPRGWQQIFQGNKKYLRGIPAGETALRGEWAELLKVPAFFSEAIERAAWHARQGNKIVLVTGTLEPLALGVAVLVKSVLRDRGCDAGVHVLATRLEERDGRWSGRIEGEAMFGEAKGRAIRKLAEEWGLDLARCSAYGDSASDRWMLESVGKAYAVNPTWRLRRIARRRGWPIICWGGESARRKERLCSAEKEIVPEAREILG
jgi:HAD superfamily hydrolase (TIGR01490 family)